MCYQETIKIMKILIKQIDPKLPKPQYHTSGSVAFDLVARIKIEIEPFKPTIIPLNVIIKIPKNYVLILAARSSLPLKKNLMVANGIGIIDQDYCGENDEIGLQVINFSKKNVVIDKGERIAQAMLVRIGKVSKFNFLKKAEKKSRGGFGSTG